MNSSVVYQENLGGVSASTAFQTTGVKTVNITVTAPTTVNAGDLLVISISCASTNMSDQTFTWIPDATFVVPLSTPSTTSAPLVKNITAVSRAAIR